jgi:ribosome-associated protein YbcJ (S4-like RNA binding protein)
MIVDEGFVQRNGETEYRRRAKLHSGDIIDVEGDTIQIV